MPAGVIQLSGGTLLCGFRIANCSAVQLSVTCAACAASTTCDTLLASKGLGLAWCLFGGLPQPHQWCAQQDYLFCSVSSLAYAVLVVDVRSGQFGERLGFVVSMYMLLDTWLLAWLIWHASQACRTVSWLQQLLQALIKREVA